MFTKARIKLTAYYLAIIMAICLVFSSVIYTGFVNEFRRGLRIQERVHTWPGLQLPSNDSNPFGAVEDQIFNEIRDKVILDLAIINLTILFFSGAGGFFLAGKTLKPIEDMLDDHRRFTADTSHELRTPLTAMKTEIEVSLRDKKLDLSQAKKLLKSNLEEVDKMQSLANYLLDLNRYQNNQTQIHLSQINFKFAVQGAIEKILPLAKKREIVITSHLTDLNIKGNDVALTQLVVILLDNAIKYSRSKGQISLNLKKHNRQAVLEVIDHGMGIKASDMPYIFKRFYRADSSRNKNRIDGYGLGLSIAKSIIDLHRGTISVESQFGQGSKFQVRISIS